jgi:hypothetical protein
MNCGIIERRVRPFAIYGAVSFLPLWALALLMGLPQVTPEWLRSYHPAVSVIGVVLSATATLAMVVTLLAVGYILVGDQSISRTSRQ